MKKMTIISALVLAMMFPAITSFAWHDEPRAHGHAGKHVKNIERGQRGSSPEQHKQRMERRLKRMTIILDLTEKQRDELKTVMEQQWQLRQSIQQEMRANRDEMRRYRQSKQFNEAEFRAKAHKQADLKIDMMVERAKNKQQMMAILTPSQQHKAQQLWQQSEPREMDERK
ncbi:MAG: hypothetical protein B6I36_10850 [Desulfobacteraceae bacterium 4572_35.1]|nr:MAG: hypothetical protein B6I36_10850 [Desulfobacteraceae bacterium 4572_35.1]